MPRELRYFYDLDSTAKGTQIQKEENSSEDNKLLKNAVQLMKEQIPENFSFFRS
jgi:hypothetical protein